VQNTKRMPTVIVAAAVQKQHIVLLVVMKQLRAISAHQVACIVRCCADGVISCRNVPWTSVTLGSGTAAECSFPEALKAAHMALHHCTQVAC
jgi:hypothetical protein